MPPTRRPYPSDLTGQEWALLEPLLASSEGRGRPEVAPPARRGRRLLPAQERLRLADAAEREYPPWQTV